MATYDTTSAIQYYADLLLYQYINKTKARATIESIASCGVIDLLPLQVNDSFDLDTAEGTQLDVLGEYISFSRYIPSDIPRPYFKMDDYTGPVVDLIGFKDYDDPDMNVSSVFYLYLFSNTSFNRLEDTEYRPLLKLKSILNYSKNTLYEINQLLYDFFGNGIICYDQKDMTMSYFVTSSASRLVQLAYGQNLLPKPMAVGISGIFTVSDPSNLFMFADYEWDNGALLGFSSYEDGFNGKILLDYRNRIT